jgi:GxxExxY protein
LIYRGQTLDCGYRLDLLVDGKVVVEVKSIERFERVYPAQLLSYLRLSKCKVGLLINFNVKWLVRDGIKRVVNGFPA